MPSAGDVPARDHAAACPACARAVAAAASIERALASPPPVPPGGADRFVATVLESIRAERAPERLPEPAAVPDRASPAPVVSRLLGSLAAEPAFVIGAVALLLVAFFPTLSRGDAGLSLAAAGAVLAQGVDGATEPIARAILTYPATIATLDPYARAAMITCFLALLVWGGFWIVNAVDRSLRRGAERRA
jgi:hypothetical protein